MKASSMLITLLILLSTISCRKGKIDPIIGLTEIIKKRDLYLVEYRFSHVMLVHKNDNANRKLILMVKTPASISAKINLIDIKIDTPNGKIIVPQPIVDKPVIRINDELAEIIQVNDGFLVSFGGSRRRLMEALTTRLTASEEEIKSSAIKLGILNHAEKEARNFIVDLLASFGLQDSYTIEFQEPVTEVTSSDEELISNSETKDNSELDKLQDSNKGIVEMQNFISTSIEVEKDFLNTIK